MRSRYLVRDHDKAHFVTATIVEWLPVFTSAACCDILVRSFAHCREHKGLRIHAWVILDNHFHAILAAPDLSAVLRDLKSYTAKLLVAQLAAEGREWLLHQLRHFRAAHKPSEYQVWQEGSHPQAILSDEIMRQKLEYLHTTRCSGASSARPSTGGIPPPTNGCPEPRRCCGAIRGSSRPPITALVTALRVS